MKKRAFLAEFLVAAIFAAPLCAGCVGSSQTRRGGPEAAYAGPMIDFEGEVRPQITGRAAADGKGGVRMAWPGTSATLRFKGTAVSADITDNGQNHYAVLIDGRPVKEKIVPASGRTTVSLIKGLSRGEHTLTLYRLNEALVGTSTLHGFILDEHGEGLPALPDDRPTLLIIGDSISAGYGNEGADQNCSFSPESENHFLSYGARAARSLNASLTTLAWSGKGVFSNRGNEQDPMPALWTMDLPAEKTAHQFTATAPQAVVINLGTNDFAPEVKDTSPFGPAYEALLNDVRKHFADSHIFVTVGPLLSDSYPEGAQALTTVRTTLSALVSEHNEAGDARVHYLEYAAPTPEEGFGCDWHPSVKTHARMAATLSRALQEKAGFKKSM